jgi:hypothetical protein
VGSSYKGVFQGSNDSSDQPGLPNSSTVKSTYYQGGAHHRLDPAIGSFIEIGNAVSVELFALVSHYQSRLADTPP